jgi:hypothetical protein
MHAVTAWDLKFQVCLRYTLIPDTLPIAMLQIQQKSSIEMVTSINLELVRK